MELDQQTGVFLSSESVPNGFADMQATKDKNQANVNNKKLQEESNPLYMPTHGLRLVIWFSGTKLKLRLLSSDCIYFGILCLFQIVLSTSIMFIENWRGNSPLTKKQHVSRSVSKLSTPFEK